MRSRFDYLVGVDGGGSRTRARLASVDGRLLGFGTAGSSSLSQGAPAAWAAVEAAIDAAFTDNSERTALRTRLDARMAASSSSRVARAPATPRSGCTRPSRTPCR